jgi:hypothetical protein
VPDYSALLIARRPFRAGTSFPETGDGFLDGPELLVTGHDVSGSPIDLLKHGEVADQVKEVGRPQHSRRQDLLALKRWGRYGGRSLFGFTEEQRRSRPL